MGIQEEVQATFQLFSYTTGCLMGEPEQRVNASQRLHHLQTLSAEASQLLELTTSAETQFYTQGKRLFKAQHQAMVAWLKLRLGTDPQAVSDELQSRAMAGMEMLKGKWTPNQPFKGGNLHSREIRDGIAMRWTGPAEETEFSLEIPLDEPSVIRIRLDPATPPSHAREAKLSMAGQNLPITVRCWENGHPYLLEASIPRQNSRSGRFRLFSPVHQGDNEWRLLGLCLKGISVETV